jgi:glycosyltransferase involved in cell wall biosynthesis
MPFISVVSPVYNSQNIVPLLISRLEEALRQITEDYEIILVDDYSSDNSWQSIESAAKSNQKIKGIKLSRNFGQHYAITAGLDYTIGEWVIVMDCDLQDRPEEIINLYKTANEGCFDIVLAGRINRKDQYLKKMYSKCFYKVLGFLTGTKHDPSVANFGIYSKSVIREIKSLRESIRYFPTMVNWVGFKKTTIVVTHSEREEGKSGYNFKKMFNLAIDIILAYSDKPIRITIKLGIFISFISFIMSLYTFIKWYSGTINVIGYSSLIISVWFLSGCILTTLGIVGLYVGKIFEGVKGRPIYIIEKVANV